MEALTGTWIPLFQFVGAALTALTLWGMSTGRWAQSREDESRQSTRDIGNLQVSYTDLKRALQDQHTQHRANMDNLQHQLGDMAERLAVTSQRVSDLDRRLDRCENRENRP